MLGYYSGGATPTQQQLHSRVLSPTYPEAYLASCQLKSLSKFHESAQVLEEYHRDPDILGIVSEKSTKNTSKPDVSHLAASLLISRRYHRRHSHIDQAEQQRTRTKSQISREEEAKATGL